jgi:hypothetical protein
VLAVIAAQDGVAVPPHVSSDASHVHPSAVQYEEVVMLAQVE